MVLKPNLSSFMFLFIINAVLNCEVISKSFADCLKLNSSLILISFLTDLAPFVSQANFVINNFSFFADMQAIR